jgi:hypothetical protein
MRNQKRRVLFESISLGLENWNCEVILGMRTSKDGDMKKDNM